MYIHTYTQAAALLGGKNCTFMYVAPKIRDGLDQFVSIYMYVLAESHVCVCMHVYKDICMYVAPKIRDELDL